MASIAIKRLLVLQELCDDSLEQAISQNQTDVVYIINHPELFEGTGLSKEVNPQAHVENYAEVTVPQMTDYQFKTHFRMYPEVFEGLCEWIGPDLKEKTVPVSKKLLATIWLLASTETYRSVADRFGFNKGALRRIVMSVTAALVAKRREVIRWPDHRELKDLAAQWQGRAGIKGVVGAIDGTFIQIPGTTDGHRDAYICRKGFPAMQLQVVCDKNLRFLDVTTGYPGSVHDARVFRNCELKTILESDQGKLPPQYFLLGDSAYPTTDYLLPPFRDNGHLGAAQKRFNKAQACTRVEVERSIGLLKGKFRRLKYLNMVQVLDIPKVIFAACILHNYILIQTGIDEDDIVLSDGDDDDEVNDEDAPVRSGEAKRLAIARALV